MIRLTFRRGPCLSSGGGITIFGRVRISARRQAGLGCRRTRCPSLYQAVNNNSCVLGVMLPAYLCLRQLRFLDLELAH